MPRLLPFLTSTRPSADTIDALASLVNDMQILALDRTMLLALARYAHQLAINLRASLKADGVPNDHLS